MTIKNNNQSAQSTSMQEDCHVITNSANEVIEAFGKDSEIGKSYARLAEAAEENRQVFRWLFVANGKAFSQATSLIIYKFYTQPTKNKENKMINHNETTQANQANPANQTNEMPAIKTIFTNSDIKKKLAERGLQGLEFDYMSFPTIVLRTSFEMSDDPAFNLPGFDVTIMQSLEKHVLVDVTEESKRVMRDVKYSRDGITTAEGELITDYMAYISDKGGHPVLKRYLDLLVQLHTNDHHNQKLAVLSISPTSVSRVSGLFYQLQLQGKLENLQDLKFTVSRGQQRISRGGQPYWLWQLTPKAEAVEKAAA